MRLSAHFSPFITMLFTLSLPLLLFPVSAASAAPLGFAVVQPGQPGTPEEARPVMDSLAAYLTAKTGIQLTGEYFNEIEPALARFKSDPPAFGIVSLGFFMERAESLNMTPMASTRPMGKAKDIWRLAVPATGPDDWKKLHGAVAGSMLMEPRAASCLMFNAPPDTLPFTLEGTASPLRALRKTLKGKLAAVVLDGAQYAAAEALPSRSDLKILLQSPELPASPVVWFGRESEDAKTLAQAFMAMKNDPEAASLLELLRTDGFGPADPALAEYVLPQGEGCR